MNPARPFVAPMQLQTACAKGRVISQLLRQTTTQSVGQLTTGPNELSTAVELLISVVDVYKKR